MLIYGAMYINDAIEKKIKYYANRNEAAAPMMAEAYAKYKNNIGAVCVMFVLVPLTL